MESISSENILARINHEKLARNFKIKLPLRVTTNEHQYKHIEGIYATLDDLYMTVVKLSTEEKGGEKEIQQESKQYNRKCENCPHIMIFTDSDKLLYPKRRGHKCGGCGYFWKSPWMNIHLDYLLCGSTEIIPISLYKKHPWQIIAFIK